MKSRLFSILIAFPTLLLMLGAAPPTILHEADAQTPTAPSPSASTQTAPDYTAAIECGLWGGSNFNVGDNCGAPTSSQQTSQSQNPKTTSATQTTNPASTTSEVKTQIVPKTTAVIWCGLWNGSNLNFTDSCENIGKVPSSGQSQASTTQTQPTTPAAPSQATTPNTPTDPPTNQGMYAALGDSVAAGLGLPIPVNASNSSRACGQSSQGYPNLVASDMHLSLNNVSCSGTTVGDLMTSENINGASQQAQLSQAFAHGVPKYMSITSGANDIEWSYFLQQCYNSGNCATVANTAVVDALLVSLQTKLHAALSSIQVKSSNTPPVTAATGYYQPVSAACVQQSGEKLSKSDITWIQAATNALNQTIKQTVQQYPFAHYVQVNFSGHDVCSSNPWIQTLDDPAPFHPNVQGQAIIAKNIEAVFTQ